MQHKKGHAFTSSLASLSLVQYLPVRPALHLSHLESGPEHEPHGL